MTLWLVSLTSFKIVVLFLEPQISLGGVYGYFQNQIVTDRC